MINKLIFIVCLCFCASDDATITYEEALNALGQQISTARKANQQERYRALVLIQDGWLICGLQSSKIDDFYNAVARGDIPAMQACLKYTRS